MYDQEHAAESAAEMLRTRVDGDVAHSIGGNAVSRFTVQYPFVRQGAAVSQADVIEAIEAEGFQVHDSSMSDALKRARFDALPADLETFVVERIGLTPDGMAVIMIRHTNRIVEFDADVASDARHLALTQPGDLVTTLSTHRSGEITGFRNRTLEKMAS